MFLYVSRNFELQIGRWVHQLQSFETRIRTAIKSGRNLEIIDTDEEEVLQNL